jgi:hypothetical protein
MSDALIEVGYNKEDKVVMVVHGKMDNGGKLFDAISLLSEAQALKLSDDLKMAIIQMKADKERQ